MNGAMATSLQLQLILIVSVLACGDGTMRHHRRPDDLVDDVYVSQLERTAADSKGAVAAAAAMATSSAAACPTCIYKTERQMKYDGDRLRLEAIKRQILSKLGLRHKPNVTEGLPREVVMETLFRAEDGRMPTDGGAGVGGGVGAGAGDEDDVQSTTSAKTFIDDNALDVDDFYGRTSEIISFAEQGSRVNHNRLLEFRISTETNQAGQELRVRNAMLWLKADVRHRRPQNCRTTEIYVFRIVARLPDTVTLSSHEFDRVTIDPISYPLDETNPGWQKIDLTESVSKWLKGNDRYDDTLRLFVDCSCCGHWHIHLFNGDAYRRTNPNRPFLVVHTDPNTAKRVRRRALDCSPDSGSQCCKQRFYVSFKQLDWDDWVIAPQGYYANYCRGDCGSHRTPDTYVTYHTHVIEEVRKTHHLSGMQPCCAPLKFSSMSLIYYGPDLTIIKRDLPKMVVDECGCP